ncbi:MAG: hypothetical protein M3P01_05255 [Actinomycetota bacterium]|nr:hypothetical protein [Actinomycetota bacterium]
MAISGLTGFEALLYMSGACSAMEVEMDSLPEASAPSADAAAASPRLISGGRAIGAFLVLAGVLLGIVLLTRNPDRTAPPTTNHQQSGTFALTDSQAIAKFKELNRLRIEAFRNRDASLIAQVLTSDSPLRPRALGEIARLRADGVLDKTAFRIRDVQARSNGPNQIVLREVEVETPRFVTETGKDVSRLHISVVATVDWTLRKDGLVWKIFDSSSVKAHRLRSAP